MLGRYSILPPVVRTLLLLNAGIFILELFDAGPLIVAFALWPVGLPDVTPFGESLPHFQPWQLLTYSFLHGGIMHLLLNMYALWMFGSRMESVWGSRIFTVYYGVCVVGAALAQLLFASQDIIDGDVHPAIGASGGVFGLLLAFGMTFPNEKLMLLFPPVVMSAKWFVLIYGLIELWAGVTGTASGVAHFAHLGGMFFGFFLLWYWRIYPPRFR